MPFLIPTSPHLLIPSPDRTATAWRRCAKSCPSALGDFLELELIEHRLGVGVAAAEGASELVLLLGLQLRRKRRHVAVDDGVDHEGSITRQRARPRARDF